ncbi:hypothetical protein [Bizionia arctica]|uniref:TerB family tellurite resistance protein n=1 Tax=Bizionia arctica TaxID=1495645 RepID=A0A917GA73_9FLAO|nr:hypothetical protein [Bizionia arctica]GGG33421.1 hypothetical protein GCM10010976_01440 [Bizionia arctica]
MKNKKHLNVPFYEILGKLFYAIAAIDGAIKPVEFNKLKEIIKTQWLDETEDNFQTDAIYQIEVVFNWLNVQNNLNSEALFKDFVEYKNEHNHFFTPPIKKLIIKTAHGIADSFCRKNKSELILLAKLDMELKKTND